MTDAELVQIGNDGGRLVEGELAMELQAIGGRRDRPPSLARVTGARAGARCARKDRGELAPTSVQDKSSRSMPIL